MSEEIPSPYEKLAFKYILDSALEGAAAKLSSDEAAPDFSSAPNDPSLRNFLIELRDSLEEIVQTCGTSSPR